MNAKRWTFLAMLLLVGAVIAAYWPVIRDAGFIWDDDVHVVENKSLRGAEGFADMWQWPLHQAVRVNPGPPATPQYYPLVFTTFFLEWQAWETWATGYHIVNILIHIGSVVLLYKLLKVLQVPGALLAAAIFALHPVQVESVAWISERKNTLAMFFMLASALAYVHWSQVMPTPARAGEVNKPSKGLYVLALLLFAAAMFSKTVACVVPVVLGLILWWKGRLGVRQVAGLVPLLALGVAMGLLTVWIERKFIGASGPEWDLTLAERLRIAGHAVWFYPYKLIAPVNLTFIYPRWDVAKLSILPAIAAVLVLGGVTAAGIWQRRFRGAAAAVLAYAVMIFPALGFFNIYPMRYSFVADHFGYMATAALMVLIAAGAAKLTEQIEKRDRWMAGVAAAPVLVLLGVLTFRQGRIYENQETLWTDTIARNPACWMAYENLGDYLRNKARVAENGIERERLYLRAVTNFRKAIELRETAPEPYLGLGLTLFDQGRFYEALEAYAKGNAMRATDEMDRRIVVNMAVAYNATGQFDWANRYLENVDIAKDPLALQAKGYALIGLNEVDAGISYLRRAIEVEQRQTHGGPNPYVLEKIALAYIKTGRDKEAKDTLFELLRIKRYAAAHQMLGFVLRRSGDVDLALRNFEAALALDPQMAEAHVEMGEIYALRGHHVQAAAAWRQAILLSPTMADPHASLAHLLHTTTVPGLRNDQEALRLARRAVELQDGRDLVVLRLLADLEAYTGHYQLAVAALEKAREMARRKEDWQAFQEIQAKHDTFMTAWTFQRLTDPGSAAPATQEGS